MAYLNYKHLRYFWAVAKVGNLTRAAEQLNVSQSALSIQIRKLEEQLGQDLFDRQGRRLILTEVGKITLDHADTIFATGDELIATLSGAPETRPTLRIGALATLSRNFQVGLLQPLLDQGEARIILRSGTPEIMLRDLEMLNLDLVLMNAPAGRDHSPLFRSHRLFEQHVSLIATPSRAQQNATIDELLKTYPFILPTQDSSIRIGFDALAQRLGATPKVIAEADDMAMMRLLARRGIGIAPLPPVVVKDELASGELVELCHLEGVVEAFYAITADRKFPNPAVNSILESMINISDK